MRDAHEEDAALADAAAPDARCEGVVWQTELSDDIPSGAEVVAGVIGGDLVLREERGATLSCGTPSAPCATIKVFAGGLTGDFDVTIELVELDAVGYVSAGAFARTGGEGPIPNVDTAAVATTLRFQRIDEEITVTSTAADGEVSDSGPFERAPATIGMTLLALDNEGAPGSSVHFPRVTVQQGGGLASDNFDCDTLLPQP